MNYQELVDFRDRHIHMSERIASESAIRRHYRKKPADVVIVGSDQVWRPCYSPSIRNFYLDFLDDIALDSYVNGRNPVKRISYAASFGVDSWEYTPEQTAACSALAKKFDAVSVREQSAQVLCREHLGVSADWVIDPTLLLEASDYEALMPDSGASAHAGKLLAYILDPAEDKQDIAEKLAGILELDVFSVKPERERTEVRYGQIDEYQCPAVEDWLQGFRDAAFVVTDSFHGCVFSIIFNKPFVAVGNPERGLARFESLLQLFELQDRLVSTTEQVNGKLASAAIDWARVNRIRHTKAEEAKAFLRRHLEQCVAGRDSPKNMSNPDLAKQRGQPDQ